MVCPVAWSVRSAWRRGSLFSTLQRRHGIGEHVTMGLGAYVYQWGSGWGESFISTLFSISYSISRRCSVCLGSVVLVFLLFLLSHIRAALSSRQSLPVINHLSSYRIQNEDHQRLCRCSRLRSLIHHRPAYWRQWQVHSLFT
jgi:hypothetical protein